MINTNLMWLDSFEFCVCVGVCKPVCQLAYVPYSDTNANSHLKGNIQ